MAESNKLVIRKIVVGRPISTALSSGTLNSMSDVSLNGKQNGQGIFYNTAANRWENGTFTAGEGIDISWDSSANTLTFIAEYADSDNAGVAKFTSSDFSVDSVGKVDIKFNSLPESLIPASDSAYDLGSASKKWRSLYLSAGTIYLGDNKAISLDSSSGTLLFDGQSVLIAGSSASDSDIRNLFTASGGLSYNSSTGAFTDSDRTRSQILNLINVTGGGLSYNAATGTITDSDRSTSQIKGLFTASGGGLTYNSSTGAFTDSDRSTSQIKGLFSATGGGLTYNSSTGVFTDSDRSTAQIKGLFTASGAGLTYNSSTGAFTDSDRSRAQILGLHTGGTGITYNNSTGAISLTGDSNTFSGLTVTNNLTVSGNLVVAGTRTEVNTATLSVEDNIITLNSNVTGTPNTNAGIEVNRGNQNTKSIQWNETADKWYVESDGNGTFVTGLLETDSATIGGHPILTDNDGAFIKGLLSGSTGITYSNSTGAISITNTGVASATYGSSTAIPVFTVNAQGQIDSAGVVDVAGVNSASWDSASNRYRIALATGDNIDTTIGGFNNISFKSLSDSAQTVIRSQLNVVGSLSYDSATGQLSYTDSDRSAASIKGLFTASGGGLSYNNSTGAFTDSDRSRAQILGLHTGSTGITYSNSTGAISITNTGVAAATYGSATAIPVLTINAQGQIDSAGTIGVSGITGVSFDSATGILTVATSGDDYTSGITKPLKVGGSLSYDSATAVLTYTDSDRSRAQILGLHTGTSGVTYNNTTGVISIGQPVGTDDSVTFSGLYVSGDFKVGGTTTTVSTANLVVEDPLIQLASANEVSDVVDIGFVGHYYRNAKRRHTGFFRDASNQQYYLFNNLIDSGMDSTAPPSVINRAATDYDDASLNVGKLIAADSVTSGGNAVLTVAKTSWIRNLFSASGGGLSYNSSTGAFADSDRSAAQIKGLVSVTDAGGDGSLSYNSSTGVITYTGPSASEVRTHLTATGGLKVSSGVFSLDSNAFTPSVRSQLNVVGSLSYDSSTGQLSYTDSDRSAASIKGLFSATGGGLSYNSSTGVITDSDRTSAQIKGLFTVTGGGLSYNSSTGVITDSDRTANQIKELFTGGTGITFDSGAISLTGDSNTFSGLTVTNNLTVKGNLIVAGTRTEVNTAVLNIEDNIITLNSGTTGTPSENAGILVDRGNLISKSIQWNEGADKWYIESDGNGSLMTGLLEADSATIGGHPILTDNDGAFIKGLFSATGGGLSYNNSTGVFTDSDRSRAQILGMIQVGNGLNWSADSGLMTLSGNAYERYEYSATAGQVTFVDSDVAGNVLSYNTLASFITLNGVILDPSDYTASNGTSVVLTSGTDSADILGVYAFNVNGVSDTVSATNGGTFQSNLVVSGSLTATTLVGAGTGITSLNGAVVMNAIKAVDSNGSGLNADTLDGQQGAYYRINVYNAAGTLLN